MSQRFMSSGSSGTSAFSAAAESASGLLSAGVERLLLWQERARQRRALGALSDSLLKDIGISRGQAFRESGKPFWRR
jgi:uncharacterized protein YjiS (DUF1127 family)